MGHQHMINGAHAQIEIIKEMEDRNEILALASFYWDCSIDWGKFVTKVTSIGDRMFAEFDSEDSVIFYTQFKTVGRL